MASIPRSLHHWFIIHFVVDLLFAVPLMGVPGAVLEVLGFESANLVFARLVGAALIAIGGTSLLMRNKGIEVYVYMLMLKLLWSGSAIVGVGISLAEGAPISAAVFLGIFALFFIIWAYYLQKIKGSY